MEAYLDNSATTCVYQETADLVCDLMVNHYGNPSAMHQKGVEAEQYIRTAQETLAKILKVKEKEMAGYVDYDGAYLYFDRTGTAVLRTKKIIEGVPHIEGLMFDSAKAKIGKKLPVEDDSIFEKIVEVSKNLKKYNLTPDRMGCTDGGVQIYFEIVQVSLGNGNYEEKLRQVEPILKKLTELYPGKAGVLHLENYDAESESIPFVPAA